MKRLFKLFMIVFGLMAILTSAAFAGGNVNVKSIEITGLDQYRGLMMTAFYTSARRPTFNTAGSRPWIREVFKISEPLEIHGNGTKVIVPEANFKVEGFRSFNYIVLVVHSPYLDVVALKNRYGQPPSGQDHLDLTGTGSNSPFNYKDYFAINHEDMGVSDKGDSYQIHLTPMDPLFEAIEE